MNEYIFIPENGKWKFVLASSHLAAYSLECSWYKSDTKIAILDKATGITKIFSRKLDSNGNLLRVIKHKIGDISEEKKKAKKTKEAKK